MIFQELIFRRRNYEYLKKRLLVQKIHFIKSSHKIYIIYKVKYERALDSHFIFRYNRRLYKSNVSVDIVTLFYSAKSNLSQGSRRFFVSHAQQVFMYSCYIIRIYCS